MNFPLECKKVKQTGLIPAFLCGGLLAAAVPILNMAIRSEQYLQLSGSPIQILMDANWQLMAMLNVLFVAAGACLMYHTEYADNAMQKMYTLPTRESKLFFGKALLMAVICAGALVIEAAGTAFCVCRWFSLSAELWLELLKSFGYAWLLTLPTALSSLLIASACKNMWVSLGIGMVCVFTATVLSTGSFAGSLFPFALPFQRFPGTSESTLRSFILAGVLELFALAGAEMLFLKIRRFFS